MGGSGAHHILGDLRVLDLSCTMAGAMATNVLADFGADVVLVEPPGGSPLRRQRAWPFWARGKSSVVLDLSSPSDQDVARRLAAVADVVVEAWRPGIAEARRLGYDQLRQVNPRLIYLSVTGFGRRDDHLARLAGYEAVVMAKIGGLSSLATLTPRRGPAFVTAPFGTFSAAHLALHGVLGALIERQRSGLGQRVDATLAQGVAAHDTWNWLLHVMAQRYDKAFTTAPTVDEERLVPNSPFFFRLLVALTADGRWLQFSQTSERLWQAFLEATDLTWTQDDERLRDAPGSEDPAVRVEFWDLALAAVRSRTHEEWLAVFDEHPDVWAEVFRHGTELLDHPQLVADGRVVTIDDEAAGPVRQPGALARIEGAPAQVDRPAPELGGRRADATWLDVRAPGAPDGPPPSGPPLAGVTVVELGTFFAGPFGATVLAELGARVIKVEPLGGDPIRNVIPLPELSGIKVLHGKESIAVDLATPSGRQIAMALVERADVVVQSYRAGVASRLGLDCAAVMAANPNVVYVEAPGYGTGPPCGHRPAFAPTIGAGSGLAYRNLGGPANVSQGPDLSLEEVKRGAIRLSAAAMGVAHADGFSALAVATACLLGLVARERFGRGQVVSTSMLATMAHALSETVVDYPAAPMPKEPDALLLGLGARYRLYETAEGWLLLAAPGERDWERLAAALELEPALEHDAALGAVLERRFAELPAAEWERQLVDAGVTAVEVARDGIERTLMLGDLGRRLGIVVDAEHPIIGDYPRLGPLVALSRSASVVGPAPACGAHTVALLTELGHDASEVERLHVDAVVASP